MLDSMLNWMRALFLAACPRNVAQPMLKTLEATRRCQHPSRTLKAMRSRRHPQPDAESNAELLASQPNGCGSGWTI